jgi:MFS family permease
VAVGIPVSGWTADRDGTRRVFGPAVAIFTVTSVRCRLSVYVPMLGAARVLQGLGALMMTPVGRLAIVRTFAKAERLVARNLPCQSGREYSEAPTTTARRDPTI